MNATTRTATSYAYEVQQFAEASDYQAETAAMLAHLNAFDAEMLDSQQSTTTAKAAR